MRLMRHSLPTKTFCNKTMLPSISAMREKREREKGKGGGGGKRDIVGEEGGGNSGRERKMVRKGVIYINKCLLITNVI